MAQLATPDLTVQGEGILGMSAALVCYDTLLTAKLLTGLSRDT